MPFARDVSFLKAKATRQSMVGVGIAVVAIVVATTMVAYFQTGGLTLAGVASAQRTALATDSSASPSRLGLGANRLGVRRADLRRPHGDAAVSRLHVKTVDAGEKLHDGLGNGELVF